MTCTVRQPFSSLAMWVREHVFKPFFSHRFKFVCIICILADFIGMVQKVVIHFVNQSIHVGYLSQVKLAVNLFSLRPVYVCSWKRKTWVCDDAAAHTSKCINWIFSINSRSRVWLTAMRYSFTTELASKEKNLPFSYIFVTKAFFCARIVIQLYI